MKIVNEEKSWLEWVVFVLSCILIVSVVGYLVSDAVADHNLPPDLRITLGQPVPSAHGYSVPVKVQNHGDQTAQAVELEIKSGDEEATLTYDFLSSGEVRNGWVGFSKKPGEPLTARVVGYRAE